MISVYWFCGCISLLSLALIRVTIVIDRQRKQIDRQRKQIPAASGWGVRSSLGGDCLLRMYVCTPYRSVCLAWIDLAADDYEQQITAALFDAEARRDTLNALVPEMEHPGSETNLDTPARWWDR